MSDLPAAFSKSGCEKMNEKLSEVFARAGFSDPEANAVLLGAARVRAEEKSFLESFGRDWGSAFTTSECFYVIVSRAVAEYEQSVAELSELERGMKINTYTALYNIYRRASQQFAEIMTLVKNGFSDGAFARWRSMHELVVIASFVRKYGEPVAEKFIEASDSEDRYDWAMASGAFRETKRHVTFGDILKLTDMNDEVWKENYTVANQTVHASPQGTFGRLGEDSGGSGRSGYGIAAPAIQSANTLALITSMLLSVFPEEKTVGDMARAARWLDELTDAYYATHERLYPEE